MARTEIKTLGEFGLIDHLTQDIKTTQKSTVLGVGDDCAILDYGKQQALVSTDLLLEGVHFNLEYVPLRHLGWKAISVNVSDIVAMGGVPSQVVVALGVSARFCVEDLEALYEGMRAACAHYNVDLVGGDTTASLNGLTISVTALGHVTEGRAIRRSGAKVNDLICCTGNLGAAYMGLQLLERERVAGSDDEAVQRAFEGKEYILQRQLKPVARLDVVESLRKAGIQPTAMMDISDGLSSELLHIAKASGVGCNVYADKLPIDYQTAAMAEEMNLDVVTCVLNGGEDYELLFTIDQKDYEKIIGIEDVNIIGYVQKEEYGTNLITREGVEVALKAQGFNAFKE